MFREKEPMRLNEKEGLVPDRPGWPDNTPSLQKLMEKAGLGELTKVPGVELDIPAYGGPYGLSENSANSS